MSQVVEEGVISSSPFFWFFCNLSISFQIVKNIKKSIETGTTVPLITFLHWSIALFVKNPSPHSFTLLDSNPILKRKLPL